MNHRIRLNISQLCERLAISKQSIWRWTETGDFPRPHYIGASRRWWLDEVEEWERQNTRTTPPIPACRRAAAACAQK